MHIAQPKSKLCSSSGHNRERKNKAKNEKSTLENGGEKESREE